MSNPWISHVKQFAQKHGIKYNDAIKHPDVKTSYKKGGALTLDPSNIKLKLDDEKYNLTPSTLSTVFKNVDGAYKPKSIGVKYTADDGEVDIPPNPLINAQEEVVDIPPNPLIVNDINPIPPAPQFKTDPRVLARNKAYKLKNKEALKAKRDAKKNAVVADDVLVI